MQIRFEFQTKYGVYKDALNLSEDHGLSEEEIEVLKQQRVDRWVYNIEHKPESVLEETVILNDEELAP